MSTSIKKWIHKP